MRFNPLQEGLLELNPVLNEIVPKIPEPVIEEVKEGEDPPEPEWKINYREMSEQFVRFVIACYDPHSPLIKDHNKLNNRQGEACRVAGIEDDRILKVIFDNSDEFIVELIHNYLKEIANFRLWAQIQANESVFWEYVRRMMRFNASDDDDTMKSKIGEELDKISARLDAYYKTFYGDDGLQRAAEKVKRRSSPESWGVKKQ